MDLLDNAEVDSLSTLEERIVKAVELVAHLRGQNEALEQKLSAAQSERETMKKSAAEASQQYQALTEELDALRAERKQVRTRIEKLLGQMDLLSAS